MIKLLQKFNFLVLIFIHQLLGEPYLPDYIIAKRQALEDLRLANEARREEEAQRERDRISQSIMVQEAVRIVSQQRPYRESINTTTKIIKKNKLKLIELIDANLASIHQNPWFRNVNWFQKLSDSFTKEVDDIKNYYQKNYTITWRVCIFSTMVLGTLALSNSNNYRDDLNIATIFLEIPSLFLMIYFKRQLNTASIYYQKIHDFLVNKSISAMPKLSWWQRIFYS